MSRALDLKVLDCLRGLAALYVVAHHAAWFLWADVGYLPDESVRGFGLAIANVAHHLFRFGYEAVLLFFIISGFCIHFRQARHLAASRPSQFNFRDFAFRRLRRLYPPLVVALLLTMLFDGIGQHINPDFYASNTPYPAINAFIHPSYAPEVVLGNFLMQAYLFVPWLGTNGPLWSLSTEFWLYALYPVMLMLGVRFKPAVLLGITLGVSVLTVAVRHFLDVQLLDVLVVWVVWTAGALVAEAYVGRTHIPHLRWATLAALVVLVGLFVTYPTYPGHPGLRDVATGLAFSVLFAAFVLDPPLVLARAIRHLTPVLEPLGAVSYSLYLVHVPTLILISAWWLSVRPTLPLGGELAAAGMVVALGLAWLCWFLVERHFVTPLSARSQTHAGTNSLFTRPRTSAT